MSTTNPTRNITPYQRPPDEPTGGHHVMALSGNQRLLKVDGHPIPYLDVREQDREQVIKDYGLDKLDDQGWADPNVRRYAEGLSDAITRGEPLYCLFLDDRFGTQPVPESEVNRWAWFLANAMAVSAGYTSHGENSRPINRHGPSRA